MIEMTLLGKRMRFHKKPCLFGRVLIFGATLCSFSALARTPSSSQIVVPPVNQNPSTIGSDIVDGVKIPNFQKTIQDVFPEAASVRERSMVPARSGGSSFMGLVSRLLGDRPHREFEGIKTRRYIYHALDKNNKVIGVVHGARTMVNSQPVDVVIFYNLDSSIRDIRVDHLPDGVRAEFAKGDYLNQFIGRPTEDFEIVRGRRGKISSKGAFFSSVKRPASAAARNYFEQITRSVRFNAAFMDVAYFITQHPDLDTTSEKVVAEVVGGAPEAFVSRSEDTKKKMSDVNDRRPAAN